MYQISSQKSQRMTEKRLENPFQIHGNNSYKTWSNARESSPDMRYLKTN